MTLVAVYGTLRKGMGRNFALKTSKYLGLAKTVNKYLMYFDTYPKVSKHEEVLEEYKDKLSNILVEIYEVDNETLHALDRIESHPGFYKRELVKVNMIEGEQPKIVYLYFINAGDGENIYKDTIVSNGDYLPFYRQLAKVE